MIPELPKSVTDIERLAFYSDILSNLEDQSTIHTNWHTHKQNPAVCWICDIPICARKIAYIVEKNITKSPLDIETELNQVDDSELEIEDDIEHPTDAEIENGYNEPEFIVEDEETETEDADALQEGEL